MKQLKVGDKLICKRGYYSAWGDQTIFEKDKTYIVDKCESKRKIEILHINIYFNMYDQD